MRPTPKRLVVNADDLGYDPEIDRGIFEAHARGMVTSATAMVDTPFAPAALRAAPGSLALGLHAVMDPALPRAQAEAELVRQIARFAALRGAPPTHLDSHKHHHARPELLEAFAAAAAREACRCARSMLGCGTCCAPTECARPTTFSATPTRDPAGRRSGSLRRWRPWRMAPPS